jgi:lysozyme family protein
VTADELFDRAFVIVVGIEGKLSTDPRDPGNWRGGKLVGTKYGVAAAYHPGVDVPSLTLEDAKRIHLAEYWRPAGCYLMPPRAALCAYDCAINQGPGEAVELMQEACGIFPDGKIGPLTRASFSAITSTQLARFMAERAERYTRTRGFSINGDGWFDRLFTVALAELEA